MKKTVTDVRFKCTAKCRFCGKGPCNAVEHVKVTTVLPKTKAGWMSLLKELKPKKVLELGKAIGEILKGNPLWPK